MKTKIISIIGAFYLVGCSSVPQPTSRIIESDVIDKRNYTIGNPITVSVGSAMIKRQKYAYRIVQHDGFVQASNDFTIKFDKYNIPFKKESLIRVQPRDVKGSNYLLARLVVKNDMIRAFVIDTTTLVVVPDITCGENVLTGTFTAGLSKYPLSIVPEGTTFKMAKKKQLEESLPYVNYEILYNGINGKTINILYREFDKEDFARSAFFQNLSYTINGNEPTLVRFRDLEIKVIKAGNEGIEFAVLKDD